MSMNVPTYSEAIALQRKMDEEKWTERRERWIEKRGGEGGRDGGRSRNRERNGQTNKVKGGRRKRRWREETEGELAAPSFKLQKLQ